MRTYKEQTKNKKDTSLLLPPHPTMVKDYLCGCITRLKPKQKKTKPPPISPKRVWGSVFITWWGAKKKAWKLQRIFKDLFLQNLSYFKRKLSNIHYI
jgi:hypothetical protein